MMEEGLRERQTDRQRQTERQRETETETETETERLIFIKTVCETLAAPPKPQIINLTLGPPRSIIIIAIKSNYYLPCRVGSLESA